MEIDKRIRSAIENTEVIKQPLKFLSTYDYTTIHYYMLSVPFYIDFEGRRQEAETILREGRITWQKPKLITPYYILRMEGFSDEAKEAFQILAGENNDIAMMLYKLKFVKDYDHMEIISNSIEEVAKKINDEVDKKKDPFCAIIKGPDEYWDVSIMKFIYELALNSAYFSNFPEMKRNNFINLDPEGAPVITRDRNGIPLAAKEEIENLFMMFKKGDIDARRLKEEIDTWGLFNHYEDRFFNMIKKGRK